MVKVSLWYFLGITSNEYFLTDLKEYVSILSRVFSKMCDRRISKKNLKLPRYYHYSFEYGIFRNFSWVRSYFFRSTVGYNLIPIPSQICPKLCVKKIPKNSQWWKDLLGTFWETSHFGTFQRSEVIIYFCNVLSWLAIIWFSFLAEFAQNCVVG